MKKYAQTSALFLMLVFCTPCKGQNQTKLPAGGIKSETKDIIASNGPISTIRNIIQDRKGNIWTGSKEGRRDSWALSRYDEKSLSEQKPTEAEIISNSGMPWGIFEDYDGDIWFGGFDGVYRYDGNTISDFKGKTVWK